MEMVVYIKRLNYQWNNFVIKNMKAYIIYRHVLDIKGCDFMVGGIESYLISLASVIKSMGIQVTIVQKGIEKFEKQIDGVTYIGLQTKGKKTYKELYKQIKGNIDENDLIIWGSEIESLKTNHKRTICIQHGIDFDYYPVEDSIKNKMLQLGLGKVVKFIQRRRALRTFQYSKYKVCVDYNFWNWYRTFALPKEEENIFVIPNFAKIGSNTNKPVSETVNIVFARRFVRRRGVEIFIQVVKNMKNYSNVIFTFAGDGPYKKQILDLAEEMDNVVITKYSPENAISFHENYDIAVVPTIGSEGTSLSLLEAMSAGNAVICTAVGGMTNIIIDGYNGLLIKPDSVEALEDAIIRLIENKPLREQLSTKAYDTISTSFSYSTWAGKWENVIKQVAEL